MGVVGRVIYYVLMGRRTVFKGDEDRNGIECHEMAVSELEPALEGKGLEGLWVVESKGFLDLSKFMSRARK